MDESTSTTTRHLRAAVRCAPTRRSVLALGGAAAVALLAACSGGSAPEPAPTTGTAVPSTPTSSPSPTGPALDAVAAGAAGDGTTDDTAALQAALDGLAPGTTLVLAAGRTFAVSDVLVIRVAGTRIAGGGVLLATDESRSSLTVDGAGGADDVVLEDVTLSVAETTRRWDAYEQQRLRVDGGTGLVVRDVLVDGSAAAGVYVGGGASGFLLERVSVRGTRADGIHLTQGCHDGRVVDPEVTGSGDDGVAVVSYAPDGDPCRDILVERPVVRGTVVGRGVSVVGGERITYRDVDLDATGAAGVYIASEGSFDTAAVSGVLVEGGRVSRANQDQGTDHGAVLVYDGSGRSVTDVVVRGITVTDTRESASRQVGVVVDGGPGAAGAVTGIELDDITISGGPSTPLVVAQGAGVIASDWEVDGATLPDPLVG